ncbi:Fe-S cluster assembly protein SufD [Candidatus Woesearchaeota archaeon]|nr:Fe-S cluster assembly protein SufD [Candidatus Woesearchaeota archaeon]
MAAQNQKIITKNTMQELSKVQSSFADETKKEALEIFKAMPIPKEREEDWRYTEIEKLKLESFEPFESKTGIIATKLSDDLIEKGIILTDINKAFEKYPEIAQKYFFKNVKTDKDKFVALNAAHFSNGVFLYVPKNIELDEPIRVNFHFGEKNSIVHNIIIVESNSKIDFIEEYSNNEISHEQLNCCVTEVYANQNSKLNFYHINNWTKNVYNFTNIVGAIERDAAINWVSGCFGGKLNRIKIDTLFNGQGSQANNLGIFLGRGKEHIDFTTNMHHNTPNTTNEVLVDGILKDESSSVYRGLIRIPKEGQKTYSYLENHILKLGDKTLANSIPSLKIDANDVKASHGATVGQIDEEHLFYLMSRGLSREEAERLIVEGFFEPIIQKIPMEELREKIREMVRG